MDVKEFFTVNLPKKLAESPDIVESINNIYQFNLGDSGNWTVDLTQPGGVVSEGTSEAPGCIVTASGEDFGKVLTNPAGAMMMFMSGKLKVSNLALGMSLQKLLG